jgi:DGQHR domain-containing protein
MMHTTRKAPKGAARKAPKDATRKVPKDLDLRVPFCQSRFTERATHTATFLVARQIDTDVYLGFLPLNVLLTGAYVDVIDPSSSKVAGCQREADRRRMARISSEFESRRPLMLDPILVNIKRGSVSVSKRGCAAELKIAVDPENRTLMVADGQHRSGGMSFSQLPADFPVPVVLTVGLDSLRLRRIVSDIGGNMVKHDRAFLGGMAASLLIGQQQGKIRDAFNADDPAEARRFKAAAAADFLRSLSDSPLYGRITLRSKDTNGCIPLLRIIDLVDWTLSRSRKLDAIRDPMDVSFIVIDFFRAMRVLVGDEFSEGVMLSARAMRVLSRLLWHVAEGLIEQRPGGAAEYRGIHSAPYADAETRYEQVLEMLKPLRSWRDDDGSGSRWRKCHSDRQTPANTWYAMMLLSLGWADAPSCVPGIAGQLEAMRCHQKK